MSAKPKIPRSAGRPADPNKQEIFARYGERKRVWEWDRRAKECGVPPLPWADGPLDVKAAILRMGKDVPAWLIEVIAREQPGAEPDAINDDFDGDHVAFMDEILLSLRRRIKKAIRIGGDISVIANNAKEYAKTAVAREVAHKSARSADDGLVSLDKIRSQVLEVHAAIVDRFEAAMIQCEADAQKALAAGTWRQWCADTVKMATDALRALEAAIS